MEFRFYFHISRYYIILKVTKFLFRRFANCRGFSFANLVQSSFTCAHGISSYFPISATLIMIIKVFKPSHTLIYEIQNWAEYFVPVIVYFNAFLWFPLCVSFMGGIIAKKKSNPSEPPKTFVTSTSDIGGSSQKKSWLPNPLGNKKVGVNASQSTGQLTTFLDANGSILTKSNNSDFGSSFFQYSDSLSAPADTNKGGTVSLVNLTNI